MFGDTGEVFYYPGRRQLTGTNQTLEHNWQLHDMLGRIDTNLQHSTYTATDDSFTQQVNILNIKNVNQ